MDFAGKTRIFVEYIDFCGKYGFLWDVDFRRRKMDYYFKIIPQRIHFFFPDPARRETVDSLKDIPIGLFYHYKKCKSSIFPWKNTDFCWKNIDFCGIY